MAKTGKNKNDPQGKPTGGGAKAGSKKSPVAAPPPGQSTKRKKRSTPEKGTESKAGTADVTVKTFATGIERSGVSWYESSVLVLAVWMGTISVVACSLAGLLEEQETVWGESGVPSNPLIFDWSDFNNGVDLSDITKFFLYCKGMAMKDGDIRECLKLAAGFITAKEFVRACENAFLEHRITSNYDIQSFIGCLLTLTSSKASIRRDVRLSASEALKKEAKTPETVLALDKEVSALSKVIRDADKKNRAEIEILRTALKKKAAEVKEFEEKTLEFRDFMKEYYSLKAGTVTPNERAQLVTQYHASQKAKAMYSLEQFVTLYCAKTAAQKVEKKVKFFRTDARFTRFSTWAESFEPDSGEESNEEDDHMEQEQQAVLNSDALADLI